MSDKYTQIANFKWGLESRRAELLEQPGALLQCQNAHINSGGEIEQRKSLAKSAAAFGASAGLGIKPIGLEVTASGLVTFGSQALVDIGTLPAGVSYRQCPHPTGIDSLGQFPVPVSNAN